MVTGERSRIRNGNWIDFIRRAKR